MAGATQQSPPPLPSHALNGHTLGSMWHEGCKGREGVHVCAVLLKVAMVVSVVSCLKRQSVCVGGWGMASISSPCSSLTHTPAQLHTSNANAKQ